ncbi:hypothetical protein MD484_g7625, partial [Candolleomyces efflorescens]
MDFDHVMKGDPAYTEPQARVGRHPQDNLSALINQYAALSLNSGSKTPRAPRVATDFDMLYNLVVDHLLSSLKEAHHKYRSTQAEVEKCEDALEEYADDPESENYLGERINLEFSILDFERAKKNLEEIQLTLDMAAQAIGDFLVPSSSTKYQVS